MCEKKELGIDLEISEIMLFKRIQVGIFENYWMNYLTEFFSLYKYGVNCVYILHKILL